MSRESQLDFCEECGVALDLHDGADSCRVAEAKADRLDQFWMGILR